MTHTLFTPLQLRNITLPGRAVRSATEMFAADADAHLPPYEVEVYRELSAQPLGMIITAHTCVSPEGHSNDYQNAIWSDDYAAETAAIAKAAQQNGVPAVMQLGHGGMKGEGHNGGRKVYTPDNMTTEEIAGVVRDFGAAACQSGVRAALKLIGAVAREKIGHETVSLSHCCGGTGSLFVKVKPFLKLNKLRFALFDGVADTLP